MSVQGRPGTSSRRSLNVRRCIWVLVAADVQDWCGYTECRLYHLNMNTSRYRRVAAGLTLASLPLVGVALAPTSLAEDCMFDPTSFDCMMNSGDDGYQPGDVVVPADGGPLQIAVAPSLDGGPVVTAGGGLVIPAGPPIG